MISKRHIIAKVSWVESFGESSKRHLITYAGCFTVDEVVKGACAAYPNKKLVIRLNNGDVIYVLEDGSYKFKNKKPVPNVT